MLALLAQTTTPIPHVPLDFRPVMPELVLVGSALVLMLTDALNPRYNHRQHALGSLAGLAGAAAASVYLWTYHGPATVLGGMVANDRFTDFFRLVIIAGAAVAVLLSYQYLERAEEARGEYYPLLLFATVGMTLITASADLIMVFLSLEILSLSLYLLTGFSFRRLAAAEASMKYFLLGAFSSAFFLYGVAMAYGATGTTNLSRIAQALEGQTGTASLALAAAGLLAVGFSFKIAAVPFHMWTPDAYQGAPTCVTAFMAAGTKVAAFAAFFRVFEVALSPMVWDWKPFIWVLAAVTMVVGSVLAMAQADIKRMLAYSSVGHAGFILVGLTAANRQGIEGAMFYLAVYAAMVLAGFGVVVLVSGRGERSTALESYAGLARTNPFAAAVMGVAMLSLAGLPPTGGFIAKVAVFSAAVQDGHWPLVLIAVVTSVIAAFYYLRVIVLMYMRDPAQPEVAPVSAAAVGRLAIAVPAILILLFGVFPSVLFTAVRSASVIRF
ncbi:MAG TPA: NADH-quinone oxidoreductase subunit N [Actinomycetota bacterium]